MHTVCNRKTRKSLVVLWKDPSKQPFLLLSFQALWQPIEAASFRSLGDHFFSFSVCAEKGWGTEAMSNWPSWKQIPHDSLLKEKNIC